VALLAGREDHVLLPEVVAMKVISLKIEEELDDRLEALVEEKGISKSELVRQAILHYLDYLKWLEEQLKPDGNKVYITRRVKVY